MNIGKPIITIIGIVLFGALGWSFIKMMKNDVKKPERTSSLVSTNFVKISEVNNSKIDILIRAEGRVKSASTVNLISEVKGEILKARKSLKEGASFKKGELIFSVRNPEAAFALKAARSGFMQLITSILPDLKLDFAQNYGAWNQFFTAIDEGKSLPKLPEVSDSREKMFLSNRQVFKSYYEIKSREAQYSKHYFYAPFNGVLMNVFVQEGTQLNPGMNVALFGKTTEKEIELALSRHQAERLKKGDKGILVLNNGKKLETKVDRVSNFIDASTHSIMCYLKVKDATQIKDGEYYEVVINAGSEENAFRLHSEGIINESNVHVFEPDSTLKQNTIELLYMDDESAVVRGLHNGQIIVDQKVQAVEGRIYKPII